MRGYFLAFMLLNHLIFVGGYWLVEINHRQLAFVEDAQGFVFLSGLLTGMVYSRKMIKNGYEQARDQIWGRAFELYRYAMGTVLVVLVAQMILPDAPRIWNDWLANANFDDPFRLATIATFVFQPTFMDILPQYIIYMLAAPILIWHCTKGRWAGVAVASLILWMAGQLGLQRIATDPLNTWLANTDTQGLRTSFNLLGWQIVFFSGLIAGSLTSMQKIEWTKVFSPEKTFIPKVALAFCLFFLPLRILTAHDLLPKALLDKFMTMEIRADFGPVYLLNFAAVAAGIAWLLIAGPRHQHPIVRKSADLLTRLFSIKYLQLLGRHSLYIYVWHVMIVYLVYYLDANTPEWSQLTKTSVAIFAVGLLCVPALYRERDKFINKPPSKMTNTAA